MPNLLFTLAFAICALPITLIGSAFLQPFFVHLSDERPTRATFIEGIFHVLSPRSKPKMIGVYAHTVVTGVTDFFSFRYWTPELTIDNSMSQVLATLVIFFPSYLRIATADLGMEAVPTFGFEINRNPKQDTLPW